MNNLDVIYEDNHIIVVIKPCNVLSQSDITGDVDMLTIVKNYVKQKYNKPGNVYIGLVHRLDRPVGGIMVFARTSKAAARLSKSIQNHEFKKQYLAILDGIMPEKNGELIDYLRKLDTGNSVVTNVADGKLSSLSYQVLQENKEKSLSLVSIDLHTGRHHQIRVQFASRGFPLYGDQRYGKSDYKQIALYAYKLSFPHPISGEILEFINYPIKKDGWHYFT